MNHETTKYHGSPTLAVALVIAVCNATVNEHLSLSETGCTKLIS